VARDDQAPINQQLFELLVLQVGQVNELALHVAVLRQLVEQLGVSRADFDQRLAEARAQVGPDASAVLARIQTLIETLKLEKQ